MKSLPAWCVLPVSAAAIIAACSSDAPPPGLSQEELYDPQICASCHPNHVREWSGSMHAYAAEDPVFVAMNARMQRETGGAFKDFCVRCHAPMAVRLGLTTDGSNLADLPSYAKGVTCYFCHSVDAVEGEHNNPLRLASDGVMRGGFEQPVPNSAHRAAYSTLHDRERLESANLCGTCHDIVTPGGVHLERTHLEWKSSLFAQPSPQGQLACGKCHMNGRDDLAAQAPGVLVRRVHDHSMPGVDVALTPFPETEAQRAAVQTALDATLLVKRLCVDPRRNEIRVTLDNAFSGHGFPSGANQDRRSWVELVARRGDEVVLESGKIPDDTAVEKFETPDLLLFRDRIFDGQGKAVHMFWEASRYTSSQLPPAVTSDAADPRFDHSVTHTYSFRGPPPDHVAMRVRIRPVDFDLVDDLIQTGDLDPALRARIPTFTLSNTEITWTPDKASADGCVQ